MKWYHRNLQYSHAAVILMSELNHGNVIYGSISSDITITNVHSF